MNSCGHSTPAAAPSSGATRSPTESGIKGRPQRAPATRRGTLSDRPHDPAGFPADWRAPSLFDSSGAEGQLGVPDYRRRGAAGVVARGGPLCAVPGRPGHADPSVPAGGLSARLARGRRVASVRHIRRRLLRIGFLLLGEASVHLLSPAGEDAGVVFVAVPVGSSRRAP